MQARRVQDEHERHKDLNRYYGRDNRSSNPRG
jgi:hypothetical protein